MVREERLLGWIGMKVLGRRIFDAMGDQDEEHSFAMDDWFLEH